MTDTIKNKSIANLTSTHFLEISQDSQRRFDEKRESIKMCRNDFHIVKVCATVKT